MIPGQRVSRQTQQLESLSLNVADGDGFDDFGIPTSANRKGRASASGGKRSGLFGRIKRKGPATNASEDALDDSDDDGGSFDVIPGGAAPRPSDVYANPGPYGNFAGNAPPAAYAQHTSESLVSQPGAAAAHNRVSQGEISMDQISSLRDRHRYPAVDEDPKNGRAMSLTSMSNYDTTPIIPTLGPIPGSGPSGHGKSSQTEKYRQRMIESRRALLSSETGIPLANSSGKHANDAATPGYRTMSMNSVHSQLGGVGGRKDGPPSQRSSTMSSGQYMPQYPPHQASPQGFPHQRMAPPQGPNGASMMMRGGPPGPGLAIHMQGAGAGPPGAYPRLPQMQDPYAGAPPSPRSAGMAPYYHYPNSQYMPPQPNFYGQGGSPNSPMGPPLSTPQLNGSSSLDPQSPGRQDMRHPQFQRGKQPPQVGLQRDVNDSTDFDFGPSVDSSTSLGASHTGPEMEALNHQIDSLHEDIRVLSIELAESVRRELKLPPDAANMSDAKRSEKIAAVYQELSLERTRREALQSDAVGTGIDSPQNLREKLAELEYRHSEATHLLSIRTEQYEALKSKYALLEKDFAQRKNEMDDFVSRAKERQVSQQLYEQDENLRAQISVLEQENAKLRGQLDNFTSRGPLGGRVTALEDQRSALQEALRAMRERKDAEINALKNRIEALNLSQHRPRTASSGSGITGIIPVGTPSYTSLYAGKENGEANSPLSEQNRRILHAAGQGDDDSQLHLPRLRTSSLSRPASPLHLGLDYNR